MDSKVKPKQKRRNSERRKEKSRDAARCRRSKETEIFQDLASLLPLPAATVNALDKASVMRIAISYLKTKQILDLVPLSETPAPSVPVPEDSLFLKALDGFVLAVSGEGDLVFLSENVSDHLGLSQVDLMGQSIYELTHPCDHNEVKSILAAKDLLTPKSIFIRLKCTLTSKGRNLNVKAATYKVIHCTGHLVRNQSQVVSDSNNNSSGEKEKVIIRNLEDKENSELNSDSEDEDDQIVTTVKSNEESPGHCFVAIGEPIPHPANYEIPLSHTFLTKHSLDMKFTYADETMQEFLGFNPDIFISKSVFEFHHTQDSFHLQNSFKHLFAKGQCQTDRYRFLAYGGGYIWVLTQATLIYNKGQKAQSVVCVNFVISGIEQPGEIFSLCQLPKVSSNKKSAPVPTVVNKPVQVVTKKPLVVTNTPVASKPEVQEFIPKQSVPESIAKPTARVVPTPKPLTAPLEKILPLPVGITIPKVTSFSSLLTPLPLQTSTVQNIKPLEECTLAEQSGTTQTIHTQSIVVEQENIIPLAAESVTVVKGTLDPNSVAGKFLSSLQLDNPLVRALISENNNVLAARPQAATAKIFAPRTEEMNTGYLTFNKTGATMLKEEPEDLTHLAPTAGDTCVPLDDPSDFYPMCDPFDDIILPDNYCPLLSDACDNEKPMCDMSPAHAFYTYRDDRSLSPDALTHSPDACSLPSLSSLDSPPMIEDSMPLWSLDLESSSEDLSVRAPYIPMPSDDLSLLTAGDLMWGVSPAAPKPLSSQDPLLSSHSKSSTWCKSNTHTHNSNHHSSSSTNHRHSADSNSSSLAKLLKSDSYNGRQNLEDAGGGQSHQSTQQTKYNKYSTKKGNTSQQSSSVLDKRSSNSSPSNSNKRCATPPEWDHRGYWKRSRTPSLTAQNALSQAQTARHNSVLMNLLVSGCDKPPLNSNQSVLDKAEVAKRIRLKSLSLIDTDNTVDFEHLTTQDYEVNAPTSNLLLGEELLCALEQT